MTVVDIAPPELPALRFHQLRRIGQSPAHYKASIEADVAPAGTALHSTILGGKRLAKWDRMTESGRSAPRSGQHWEAFKRDNADALILTPSEYDEAAGMAASVRACPEAMRVLDGAKEQTLYWDILGRRCRGTPDVRSDQYITDLKSTRTADPRRFMWEMLKYAYHAQLAWYLDGNRRALADLGVNKAPEIAYIVAVENSPPYVTTVFRLTERALEAGHRLTRIWLETLQNCEESNFWPGYSQCVVPLDVPDSADEMIEDAA